MIIKNQSLNVQKAVIGWLAVDKEVAEAILFGIGNQERHTAYRMNQILEAYQSNTTSELPAIDYEPQYGSIANGRHRLAVAYLMGAEMIQADMHYS